MCQVKSAEDNLKIITSVISVWNFLFSTKGVGKDKALTLKDGLNMIGEELIMKSKVVGEYERFPLIQELVEKLSKTTGKKAVASIVIKTSNPNKINDNAKEIEKEILNGLTSKHKAYIYLAYEDIFNPVGYEITPLNPLEAYKKLEDIPEKSQ